MPGVTLGRMRQSSHLQRFANHLFASCARLALGILATHLQEQPGRVFDHFAGLLESAALAVRAGDLRHRDHPPAVLGVLVDSSQLLHDQPSLRSTPTSSAGSTSSALASLRIVLVYAGLPCSIRCMVFLCTPDTSLRSEIDMTRRLRSSCNRSTLTSTLHDLPTLAQFHNILCLCVAYI